MKEMGNPPPQDLGQSNSREPASPFSSVPGPGTSWLGGWRGNAVRFFGNPVKYMLDLEQRFGNVARLCRTANPPLSFYPTQHGSSATLFAFGPACNRQILTNLEAFQTSRPRGPKIDTYERLSENILFMNGEKHKQQRRMLMPAFTREHLKAYHAEMIQLTSSLLESWRDGSTIDLFDEMGKVTSQIASRTLFGLDPNLGSRHLAVQMRQAINGLFSPATLLPLDLPGTPYRSLRKSLEAVEEGLLTEIDRKKASGELGDDVLSLMIETHDEDGTKLTDSELVSQAFVLYFAGHDTASCALTWTLLLLALHPESLEALNQELDAQLGGEPPTYDQIYSLPRLDRVLKESLRLLPPGVMFPRVAAKDTELGGFTVPAGSEIFFSPLITQRNPQIYPDPKRFRPDRWKEFKPSIYEYLPFGAGARRCLGASFGEMQLRIILPMILQAFRFEIPRDSKIDIHVNVVMSPKGGLQIIPRDRKAPLPPDQGRRVDGYLTKLVDLPTST